MYYLCFESASVAFFYSLKPHLVHAFIHWMVITTGESYQKASVFKTLTLKSPGYFYLNILHLHTTYLLSAAGRAAMVSLCLRVCGLGGEIWVLDYLEDPHHEAPGNINLQSLEQIDDLDGDNNLVHYHLL